MSFRSVIQGAEFFVPENRVPNSELCKKIPITPEWIIARTGIEERRYAESDTCTSDIAIEAIKKLLKKTNSSPADFDLLVCATLSSDHFFPGMGTTIQHKLGFSKIPAVEVRAQCSGFVYGLSSVDAYIRSGKYKKVLFVCAEIQNSVLDFSDKGKDMAILFGDGAGAIIVEAQPEEKPLTVESKERGVIDIEIGGDGAGLNDLIMKTPGSANPSFMRHEDIEEGTYHPTMNGLRVFRHAVTRMVRLSVDILKRHNLNIGDIDLVIPHQANLRINEAVRQKLEMPEEKFFHNIQKYGNTTAATIPIALAEAEQQGRLKTGDLILTPAFGAGFTWGIALIRW